MKGSFPGLVGPCFCELKINPRAQNGTPKVLKQWPLVGLSAVHRTRDRHWEREPWRTILRLLGPGLEVLVCSTSCK